MSNPEAAEPEKVVESEPGAPENPAQLPLRMRMTTAAILWTGCLAGVAAASAWDLYEGGHLTVFLLAMALAGLVQMLRHPWVLEADRDGLTVRRALGRRRRWTLRDVVAVELLEQVGSLRTFPGKGSGVAIVLQNDPPLVIRQRWLDASLADAREAMVRAWRLTARPADSPSTRRRPGAPSTRIRTVTVSIADWRVWTGQVLAGAMLILQVRAVFDGRGPTAWDLLPGVIGGVLLVWGGTMVRGGLGTVRLDENGIHYRWLFRTLVLPWRDIVGVAESWEDQALQIRGRAASLAVPLEVPGYDSFRQAVLEAWHDPAPHGDPIGFPLQGRQPVDRLILVGAVAAGAAWAVWTWGQGAALEVRVAAALAGPLLGLILVARHPLRLKATWGGFEVRWLWAKRAWIPNDITRIERRYGRRFDKGLGEGALPSVSRLVLVFQDGRRLTLSQRWTNLRLADLERALRRQ